MRVPQVFSRTIKLRRLVSQAFELKARGEEVIEVGMQDYCEIVDVTWTLYPDTMFMGLKVEVRV